MTFLFLHILRSQNETSSFQILILFDKSQTICYIYIVLLSVPWSLYFSEQLLPPGGSKHYFYKIVIASPEPYGSGRGNLG